MRRIGTSVLVSLALLAAFAAAARAAPLDDYRERVKQGVLIVRALEVTDDPVESVGVSLAVDRLRELLPPREAVETGAGPVPVDNAWLDRELDAYTGEEDPVERMRRARAMLERLEGMGLHLDALAEPDGGSASDETRARLEEILNRREFREPADDTIAKTVRAVRRRLYELLEWVLGALFGGQQGSTVVIGVRSLIIVAGIIAFVLLARLLWRLLARRDPERPRGERTVLGETISEGATAASLAAAARDLAAAGDYRGAIRRLFIALLYELDERGIVRLEANTTNREYLARVRSLGRLYPVMAAMTDTFERVWYGGAAAERADFDAFAAQHAEVSRLAAEP